MSDSNGHARTHMSVSAAASRIQWEKTCLACVGKVTTVFADKVHKPATDVESPSTNDTESPASGSSVAIEVAIQHVDISESMGLTCRCGLCGERARRFSRSFVYGRRLLPDEVIAVHMDIAGEKFELQHDGSTYTGHCSNLVEDLFPTKANLWVDYVAGDERRSTDSYSIVVDAPVHGPSGGGCSIQ
jgi:hypothetical protein